MAEVIDRRYIMLKKLMRLKKIHGHVKAMELFKADHGQEGVDDLFSYMTAAHTVENLRAAEAKGYPIGACVIPKSL